MLIYLRYNIFYIIKNKKKHEKEKFMEKPDACNSTDSCIGDCTSDGVCSRCRFNSDRGRADNTAGRHNCQGRSCWTRSKGYYGRRNNKFYDIRWYSGYRNHIHSKWCAGWFWTISGYSVVWWASTGCYRGEGFRYGIQIYNYKGCTAGLYREK